MTDEIMHYALCWYKKDQWERLKEVVADPESIEDTFEEWEQQAKEAQDNFRKQGMHVKKIVVDTEALVRWCNEQGCLLDADARSRYVAFKLQARERKLHSN